MNNTETPKKITIALEHVQLDYDSKPLGELLSKALEVLNRSTPHAEIWLSRWAIRAVCNAIIAEGEAAFPLEVNLRKARPHLEQQVSLPAPASSSAAPETERIDISVPEVFVRLCNEYYKIDAARLASALVYTFTRNPPQNLTLIKQAAANDIDDNEGDEWKDTGR